MTTATDWDATWTDTGEHPTVTTLDGAATDGDMQALLQHNHDLRAELQRTKAELAQLQSIVSPLERPWTPPTEQPTAWIEEQTIAHRAAEHRPSADTHSYIADLHKQDRQRWDSVHDICDQYTTHEPADVWDDELRALLAQPVEVDYSYRQSEAWALAEMVVGQSRQRDSVYAELAPERINEGEPPKAITPDAEMKDSVNSGPPERQPEGREGLDRMVKRVPTVISAQQRQRDTRGDVSLADYIKAIEAAEAVGMKIHPDPKPEPEGTVRASWWARLTAWFGGATTRRRQTEQGGGA